MNIDTVIPCIAWLSLMAFTADLLAQTWVKKSFFWLNKQGGGNE